MKGFHIDSDELLIAAFYDCDDDAFRELFSRYWTKLYLFFKTSGFPPLDAEDFAEETLTRVVATKGSPRGYRSSPDTSFRTWLFRIATNLKIDAWRKARPIAGEDGGDTVDSRHTPHGEFWKRTAAEDLRACLELLPEEERAIAIFHGMWAFKFRELASIYGYKSESAVYNKFAKSLRSIEACLRSKGYP